MPCAGRETEQSKFSEENYACKAREGFSGGQTLEQNFFKILKKGFAHKRKLLIKNLVKVSRLNLDTLKEIFEKCGLSEKVRAENLKVEDWITLARELT